eukprot:Skav229045  [mRNA]  locus=scaffold2828:50772:53133:+ [translate_table: standard]
MGVTCRHQAMHEKEKRLAEVHQAGDPGARDQDLVDIVESKGRQVAVKSIPTSPFGETTDFHGSLGCTFTEDDGEDASPILDFDSERLLAHCEKMQAELEQWGDLRNTPRGWQRLDEEQGRAGGRWAAGQTILSWTNIAPMLTLLR